MTSFPVLRFRNRLLQRLPTAMLERIAPRLHPVSLTLRQSLYRQGGEIDTVYFPESGMISLVATLLDGTQAEVGVVGNEGVVGLSVSAGVETSFVEAMVQIPGTAMAIGAAEFRQGFEATPELRLLLMRYNDALQAQVMQTAACSGHHQLEQRLARWLLMAHDRVEGDELPLTQEFIAMMLGVHRPSVTVVAGLLQQAGLIRYGAGRITIVDRPGVEAAACECYGVVQRRAALMAETPR